MQLFADILEKLPEYRAVCAAVREKRLPAAVTGLSQVHKAQMIYALCQKTGRKAVVIAPDEQEAARLSEDLAFFFGGGVFMLPARDFALRPVEGASHEYERERLRVLGRMADGDYNAVVACADALMQMTIPPQVYKGRSVGLKTGAAMPVEDAVKSLLAAGYARTDQVEGMGQFALRGGILDFYPPYLDRPVRVEFWGDEPDTISLFEPETQRRTESLDSVRITPAVEVHFESAPAFTEKLEALLARLPQKEKAKNGFAASVEADIERLREGLPAAGRDRYLPLCYPEPASALDYAGGALLFCSEQARVKERAKNTLWQEGEDVSTLLEEGVLCRALTKFYLEWPELCGRMDRMGAVYLEAFARAGYDLPPRELVNVTARQLAVWGGGVSLLCEDLAPHLAHGGFAVVLAGTPRACEALAHDLVEQGLRATAVEDAGRQGIPAPGRVLVAPGHLSAGFDYPSLGMMLVTHGRMAAGKLKRKSARKSAGERIRSLSEITPGDYVVHSAHGIGVYEGIQKLELQGVVKDYIKIRYAGTDTLYVPVTQLDLVSKYIGPRESGAVRLSKMGGTEWQKAKSRVRAAVKDMAKELIALYAARQKVKGFAFPEDGDMQRDFEQRFEYDETADQLRCAEEIKQDMERAFPMDRLLCGDVGFGKTEVALRAAFKCVLGGKQCALLVPTTILAWQHYQTMMRRFEGFPLRVELLSRFRTAKQQEEILRRVRRGEIDIIVGTHRLVQKDVAFRSLGLLVVDEEQRFGVAQKERLKESFQDVDVLTLSATPIPRTLNMALSGIRDMSVIEEAPQDRHPVQTYVIEYDPGILADAIKKEMRRGGQVYYLHNRVETMDSAVSRISRLVPDARIGAAHGKMSEEELSRVWEQLLNNELDVLVCTTIIETGVDVPNCNTLIIEDADRMGLSQLHQIRGRVGRSARRAYAYFTFRRGKVLSEISTKRLSAIREFTEFGSGFQIAMRDLEIRGAGNILGAQQHGHMESVGYDMYLKLLNEAVLEEKGEKQPVNTECMVDIQVSAHIPESYIESPAQRLEIYRRIADIRSAEDASDVIDELIDRFADPPQAVKSLIDVALVRNLAASLDIREITQRENMIMLFPKSVDFKAVSALVSRLRGRVMLNAGQKPYISVKLAPGQTPVETVREAVETLNAAREAGQGAE